MPTKMQPVIIRGIALHLVKLQRDGRAKLLDGSEFNHGELYKMMSKPWGYIDKNRL